MRNANEKRTMMVYSAPWMRATESRLYNFLLKAPSACQRTIVAMKFIIKLFPEITIKKPICAVALY